MSISTTVKTIQDIMRIDEGVDGDAQRISQLTWMIFLKVFDDREMEYEAFEDDYVSPLPDELRWRNWAANPEGITGDELLEFVNNQLFKTLKNINLDEVIDGRGRILKNAFEDAFNFMKNGTLMRQVINKLNEIDFNNSHDKHLFGEIYEQILKDLQSAGNAGEYYTPRAVTQFMVDMINPQLGERILDPACGTGGFLTCALEHLRKQVKKVEEKEKLPQLIVGVEKKPLPHLLCVTNMLLHEIDVPEVRRDNTLARPLRDYKPYERVEVILTNPPFGGKEEDGIETNFPAAYRTKETADLFLVLIMHLLEDGGRAGIVLPDGTLFGEGVKTRIKEKLLEECNLHTIVRLPNGVFNPYTSIKTNLLFFTKGEPTQEIWFYEHPYPPGYKSYSKTKPIRIEEFEPEKAWWDNRVENEFSWKVPVEVIKANGYNLDIKNPYREKEKHRDLETMLAEYQELMAGVSETRNLLKAELMNALNEGEIPDFLNKSGI
ncbi:MAG: type I restriction-modification system subunit M [Coleofasciculaceae cyanobacterium]